MPPPDEERAERGALEDGAGGVAVDAKSCEAPAPAGRGPGRRLRGGRPGVRTCPLPERSGRLEALAADAVAVVTDDYPAFFLPRMLEAAADRLEDAPVAFEVSFRYHVADDVAEQDVYMEATPGSGDVFRPTPAERNLDAPLYAALLARETDGRPVQVTWTHEEDTAHDMYRPPALGSEERSVGKECRSRRSPYH